MKVRELNTSDGGRRMVKAGPMPVCAGSLLYLCVVACTLLLYCPFTGAADTAVLKGRVIDIDGGSVSGALVYAYDSPDIRRPASFISARTGADGSFHIVLAPGKYWVVARLKKGDEFGPLMPGDKHSGEPVVLDIAPQREATVDFRVADLKDARKIHGRERERPVKISGRIIDGKGSPLMNVYAIAHRSSTVEGVPDYVSAWVGSDGYYSMSLPPGRYFIGSAAQFPPGKNYVMFGEIMIDADRSDVNIVVKADDAR